MMYLWTRCLVLVMLMTSSISAQVLKVNNLKSTADIDDVDKEYLISALKQLKEQLGVKTIDEYIDSLRGRRAIATGNLESPSGGYPNLEKSDGGFPKLESSDDDDPKNSAVGYPDLENPNDSYPNLKDLDDKTPRGLERLNEDNDEEKDVDVSGLKNQGSKMPGDENKEESHDISPAPGLDLPELHNPGPDDNEHLLKNEFEALTSRNKQLTANNIVLEECSGRPRNLPVKISATITPYPIQTKGKKISIGVHVTTAEDLQAPLTLQIKTFKKSLRGWMKIQCSGYWGSCTYDDVCEYLKNFDECTEEFGMDCSCPFQKGSYYIHKEDVDLKLKRYAKGDYRSEISLQHNDRELGCVVAFYTIVVGHTD